MTGAANRLVRVALEMIHRTTPYDMLTSVMYCLLLYFLRGSVPIIQFFVCASLPFRFLAACDLLFVIHFRRLPRHLTVSAKLPARLSEDVRRPEQIEVVAMSRCI
ncbi:hypothetical protein TSMEX_003543 [Taenia solium]|eukprot:TsM_000348900 transcript=TsM_000348900 gene=TsM_000348900